MFSLFVYTYDLNLKFTSHHQITVQTKGFVYKVQNVTEKLFYVSNFDDRTC